MTEPAQMSPPPIGQLSQLWSYTEERTVGEDSLGAELGPCLGEGVLFEVFVSEVMSRFWVLGQKWGVEPRYVAWGWVLRQATSGAGMEQGMGQIGVAYDGQPGPLQPLNQSCHLLRGS